MEYNYYLEQKYLKKEGRVEARIFTADQAETMVYEDGYRSSRTAYKLYVDVSDTSGLASTSDNQITLYTCVENQPAFRWCVRALEKAA